MSDHLTTELEACCVGAPTIEDMNRALDLGEASLERATAPKAADDAGGRELGGGFDAAIKAAGASGRCLIAVWHVADGQVQLYRESRCFPVDDLPIAQQLLSDDLALLSTS